MGGNIQAHLPHRCCRSPFRHVLRDSLIVLVVFMCVAPFTSAVDDVEPLLGINSTSLLPGPCSHSACRNALPVLHETADRMLHVVAMGVTGSLVGEWSCRFHTACAKDSERIPYDVTKRSKGNDWPVGGQTMIGHTRLRNVREAIESVVAAGVPGDFAEFGVWRGGACIYAQAVLEAYGQRMRRVLVFDAFAPIDGYSRSASFIANTDATVRNNFLKYGWNTDVSSNIVFIKGFFEVTAIRFRQQHPRAQIAVLRIDGNFYKSYEAVLYAMFDLVPVGGIVIFDDVRSHKDVMRCWLDFSKDQGLVERLMPIDDHSTWFKKQRAHSIDQTKRRSA